MSAERWMLWCRPVMAISASGTPAQAGAEGALTGALNGLFALAESSPDLKANQNFLQLQTELADIENKISVARRFFNNSVQEYNASTEQFPAVLFGAQPRLPASVRSSS